MKTKKWQALAVAAALLSSIAAPSAHAAAELKMGGVIFAQAVYNAANNVGALDADGAQAATTNLNNKKGQYSFDVHRLYVNGDVKWDDHWKAKFVLEGRTEGTGATASNNIYMKGAWVEYGNLLDTGLNLQFGQVPMSWDAFEGGIHNRRYVIQQFADRNGLQGTWDKGVGAYGKLPAGFGDYAVQVLNGNGTTTTEGSTANTGRNKAVTALLSIMPVPNHDALKGLRVNVYAAQEKQGLVDTGTGNYMPSREKNMLFGGLSYKGSWGHLMGTYYSGNVASGATLATNRHTRPKGYSVHGSFSALPMDMSVFARLDRFDAGVNQGPFTTAPAQPQYQPIRTTVVGIEKKMADGVRLSIADIMSRQENKGTTGKAWFHTLGMYLEGKF